jgi:hypothetical protein
MKELNSQNRSKHTKLGAFGDDVLILSKIKKNLYIYFWFDCDVSDCCIGIFETNDYEDVVINKFTEYCMNRIHHDDGTHGAIELPVEYLRGWISF